ncbi:MAG: hypothetical protein ACJ8M4_05500 [Chthoniobacterales bacterium]
MNALSDGNQWKLMFTLFAGQSPVFIVSVVACMVIVSRWNDGGRGWSWAFGGFGLSVALCIFIPITQTLVQQWAMDGSHSMAQRASVLTVLGIFWSVMRAVSLGLLLMGLIAGRPGATV